MEWIIVAGDVCKGFYFIGPFATSESAIEYAQDAIQRYSKDPWHVVKLDSPE